jgi:phage terminase small subunit
MIKRTNRKAFTKERKAPLTKQERLFCENYLLEGSGHAAALKAGYKGQATASRLLLKPHIREYIEKRQAHICSEYNVKFGEKIKKLMDIIDGLTPEEIKKIKPDAARVIIMAIAELNKMQGDYPAEKRVNANLNVNTDTDLLQVRQIQQQLLDQYKREY